MRVKIVNPDNAPGLIDPVTRRSPFIDPSTGGVLAEADVPENTHWIRRLRAGEVERVAAAPTGSEPIAPLTTRGGK